MNGKSPVFLPTLVLSGILQRTTLGNYALCVILLMLFAGTTQAMDDGFAELVITGKQSNYSPTSPKPLQVKSTTKPKSSQIQSPDQFETSAGDRRQLGITLTEKKQVSVQNNQSVLGTSTHISSSPIVNKAEQLHSPSNIANMDESFVSSLNIVRSPLRLRKHLAIRSSKNQFMRRCLLNDCFSGDGTQNFLVR